VPGLGAAVDLVRKPAYRALEVLFPSGISARLAGGESVRLHPRVLGLHPESYEEALTAVLIEHLKPDLTVLDVGAHIGLHTLMFSRRVGPTGYVIAVEPSPANARLLRSHLKWNHCRNVEVTEAAIGNRLDHVSFTFHPDPTAYQAFNNSLAYDIGGEARTVAMTTIDAICAGRHPHLIKIDVEGAELLALHGARDTLARCAPILIIAIHPRLIQLQGGTPAELVAFLNSCGYQGRHLDGHCAVDPGLEEVIFTKRIC